jgi:glyoxylase-like metal-dependent hydrolase (beta-lactamase superfamily II)
MVVLQRALGHRVEQEQAGLWRIVFHVPTSTNCWLVEESAGLTLIDAGCPWNASTILDTIRRINKPLKNIVITHAHPDHAGAAASLSRHTGAEVFAHQLDLPFLNGKSSIAEIPGSSASLQVHRAGHWAGILNPPPVEHAKGVHEGDCIGELKVIHTPGHTPGSITFYSEEHKALFIGDNASNRLYLLNINMSPFTLERQQLIESFEKYEKYHATIVLPGHGRAHHSKNANLDLVRLARTCIFRKRRAS